MKDHYLKISDGESTGYVSNFTWEYTILPAQEGKKELQQFIMLRDLVFGEKEYYRCAADKNLNKYFIVEKIDVPKINIEIEYFNFQTPGILGMEFKFRLANLTSPTIKPLLSKWYDIYVTTMAMTLFSEQFNLNDYIEDQIRDWFDCKQFMAGEVKLYELEFIRKV